MISTLSQEPGKSVLQEIGWFKITESWERENEILVNISEDKQVSPLPSPLERKIRKNSTNFFIESHVSLRGDNFNLKKNEIKMKNFNDADFNGIQGIKVI